MPIKSGLGAQLGIGTESAWGTPVTPNTFLPFISESLRLEKNYIRTAGLRAGQFAQAEDLHVATTRAVSGSFSCDVLNKGMGKLLNLLHGNVVTPTGAGTAKTQQHVIGRSVPDGKGLTVQVGRPDVGGTTRAFTYNGCKVAAVEFSCEKGGVLTATWELVGKDETTVTALATATYAADAVPFNFVQGVVEFDDVAINDAVQSAKVRIELPMKTDREAFGSSGTTLEPVNNGLIAVTANIGVEFSSLAQHAAFTGATRRKFELLFTGGAISGGGNHTCNFTLPSTVTVGAGPVVEGPDVLTQDLSLEALDDAAAPLTIDYISTDVSL